MVVLAASVVCCVVVSFAVFGGGCGCVAVCLSLFAACPVAVVLCFPAHLLLSLLSCFAHILVCLVLYLITLSLVTLARKVQKLLHSELNKKKTRSSTWNKKKN